MHGYPEWFMILLTVLTSPITWVLVPMVFITLIVLLVKKFMKRKNKGIDNEERTTDWTSP